MCAHNLIEPLDQIGNSRCLTQNLCIFVCNSAMYIVFGNLELLTTI